MFGFGQKSREPSKGSFYEEQAVWNKRNQERRQRLHEEIARWKSEDMADVKEQIHADWLRDIDEYSLRAHRFGDFLTLIISRLGREQHISVNLSKVSEIHFSKGRPPNDDGYVAAYYATRYIDGAPVEEAHIFGNFDLHSAITYEPQELMHQMMGSAASLERVQERGAPQIASDDRIKFADSASLQIPHTRGEDVHAIIMEAIAEGYEPPTKGMV